MSLTFNTCPVCGERYGYHAHHECGPTPAVTPDGHLLWEGVPAPVHHTDCSSLFGFAYCDCCLEDR